jgi:hypothetical protein
MGVQFTLIIIANFIITFSLTMLPLFKANIVSRGSNAYTFKHKIKHIFLHLL